MGHLYLLLDTCAISCLLHLPENSNDNRKMILKNNLNNLVDIAKDKGCTFVISSLVLHELILGYKECLSFEPTYRIIYDKLTAYFKLLEIDNLSESSVDCYRSIY